MWELLGILAAIVVIGCLFWLVGRLISKGQDKGRLRGGDDSKPGGFYSERIGGQEANSGGGDAGY
jgi:hypothetical protein